MKRYIRILPLLMVFFASVCSAQLSRYCNPLPVPNPQAAEPMFQLPFEIGDGFKIYHDKPDPYTGYINILPTFVLWKHTLKAGIGPEIIWSDMAPRYSATAKLSFDLWDLNVASFNNIPVGSLLFSFWGNWTNKAPVYGAGISFEFGKFLAAGVEAAYFADGKSMALEKNLVLNPFFYDAATPPAPPPVPGGSTDDKYYRRFELQARSAMKADVNAAISKLVKSHASDAGWNSITDANSLQNMLSGFAGQSGSDFISGIITSARNANALDNLVINANEHTMVISILKGLCEESE